ncbi:MAG: hypothetical protein NDI61_12950 [Bdellovibrionaceae bacterium]|nr:hypothetical protein [Pseudobdellovibrionaceae bacterium]
MVGERNWSRRFKRGTAPLYDVSGTQDRPCEDDVASADTSSLEDLTPEIFVGPPAEAIDDSLQVPIPTKIPPPPNLASLPPSILHSGAVETLIGQNEDLMARLKVNLRRNATLEQRILELEREMQQTRQENESLRDQVYIVQEKDRVYKAKNFELESQFDQQKAEIELLRTKLDEITFSTQSKIKVLETYMRRVRRWARPSMDKLRGRLDRERLRTVGLVHHIDQLRRELAERDYELSETKRQLEELQRYEREREGQFQQDQSRLVDNYESQMQEKKLLIEKLEGDLRYFKERSSRLDVVTREQVEAENKAILFARKNSELERKLNTEVHALQESAATYRGEAKSLAAELESVRAEIQRMRQDQERVENENARMSDQLESMQALWSESRRETETLELRLDALNKINQELSKKLKEQRLQSETQALNLKAPASHPPTKLDPTNDPFQRIDSALATIESGFPSARSAEAERMHALEILEPASHADTNREASRSPEA